VQMPIILEDTEDDTDVQEVHPESKSIIASPPNEGGDPSCQCRRRDKC
jgi:hypothetical protein